MTPEVDGRGDVTSYREMSRPTARQTPRVSAGDVRETTMGLCGCGAWESRPRLRERANLFPVHACRVVDITRTPLHAAHDGVHGHERCISFSDHVRLPLSAIEAFERVAVERRIHDEPGGPGFD